MQFIPTIIIVILLLTGGVYFSLNKNQNHQNPNSIETNSNQNPSVIVDNNKKIDLSRKNLSKVPSYVFSQATVESLDVSHNNLEGSLQGEIRHLKNLKSLDLSDNNFSGVPAEVGQLEHLESLDLSNNNLTGLPLELGNLSRLRFLDLSGNQYSERDLSLIRVKLSPSVVIKTN